MLYYNNYEENSKINKSLIVPDIREGNTSVIEEKSCCKAKRRNLTLYEMSGTTEPLPYKESTCCNYKQHNNQNIQENQIKSQEVENPIDYSPEKDSNDEISIDEMLEIIQKADKVESISTEIYGNTIRIFDEFADRKNIYYKQEDIVLKKSDDDKSNFVVVNNYNPITNYLKTRIIDTKNHLLMFDVSFNFNKPLLPDLNITTEEKFELLGVFSFSLWFSANITYSTKQEKKKKANQVQNSDYGKIYNREECFKLFGADVENCMCTSHDMECSLVPFLKELGIYEASGELTFWTPFAGKFKVDIHECCFNHDKELQCTSDILSLAYTDRKFFLCVINSIIEGWASNVSDVGYIVEGPLLPIILIVISIFLAKYFTIGNFIFSYDGKSTLYESLLGGSSWKTPRLDESKKFLKSCLCGGKIPTFCCNKNNSSGSCRDRCCNHLSLCPPYKGKPGKNCVRRPECYERCVFTGSFNSRSGKFDGYIYRGAEIIDKFGRVRDKKDCCNINKGCKEKCFNCYWQCRIDSQTGRPVQPLDYDLVKSPNLDCCKDSPGGSPNQGSTSCDTSPRRRTIYECNSPFARRNPDEPCISPNTAVDNLPLKPFP